MNDDTALDMAPDVDDRVAVMVEMLMRGHTVKACAEHFDVSERTVYRWKTTGEGKRMLAAAKRDALDRAHRAVSTASAGAATTLVEIARDKKARRTDRIRAAEAILKTAGVADLASILAESDDGAARTATVEVVRAKLAGMDASLRREIEVEPGALRAVQ